MNNEVKQAANANKGMVANALALFGGKSLPGGSSGDPLPGLSVNDLSTAEQSALAEQSKKRGRNEAGGAVGTNTGGAVGINKLDLMSLLKEQADNSANATKLFLSNALSEFTEQSISKNSELLATFGEGVEEQLEQVNTRVEKGRR